MNAEESRVMAAVVDALRFRACHWDTIDCGEKTCDRCIALAQVAALQREGEPTEAECHRDEVLRRDAKDAARYRLLRQHLGSGSELIAKLLADLRFCEKHIGRPECLDVAIDTALTRTGVDHE